MTNYANLSVGELRDILTTQFGYTPDEIKGKRKKTLLQLIDEIETNDAETEMPDIDLDEMIDTAELVDEEVNEETTEVLDAHKPTPYPKDPEWTEFILSNLTHDEKIKDNPTTDGLRRMVERFVGEIIESNTQVVQPPTRENEYRATVQVEIVINTPYNTQRFSGAADVFHGNSQYPFCNHPVATAETKAEGRAYKRALKLRRVSTWEELDGSQNTFQQTETIEGEEFPKFIKEEQIRFLDIMGQRVNVDVEKVIEQQCGDLKNLRLLPYDQASKLVGFITSLQDTKDKISEELQGYKNDWQTRI